MFSILPFFASSWVLFAQAAPEAGKNPDGGLGLMLYFLIPALLVLWLVLVRPGKREQERRQKMQDMFEKHVKVYTVGGLVGTIHSVDKEKGRIVLKVDDGNNTKIEFLLDAIAGLLTEEKQEKS